jgi:hypothetical protein
MTPTTPEPCKKYWNYRADSGHLYHLLYDLLGVMPTPETLGDALMQVRDRDTAIRNAARDQVLNEAIMEFDTLTMEGWSTWKFKEVLETLRTPKEKLK